MGLIWHGDAARHALLSRIGANLRPALEVARAEMLAKIGTQGPPRSRPFNAPHKDSGDLYASLFVDVSPFGLVGRVGSDVPQAVYTDRGTDRMDPRFWFTVTLTTQSVIDRM